MVLHQQRTGHGRHPLATHHREVVRPVQRGERTPAHRRDRLRTDGPRRHPLARHYHWHHQMHLRREKPQAGLQAVQHGQRTRREHHPFAGRRPLRQHLDRHRRGHRMARHQDQRVPFLPARKQHPGQQLHGKLRRQPARRTHHDGRSQRSAGHHPHAQRQGPQKRNESGRDRPHHQRPFRAQRGDRPATGTGPQLHPRDKSARRQELHHRVFLQLRLPPHQERHVPIPHGGDRQRLATHHQHQPRRVQRALTRPLHPLCAHPNGRQHLEPAYHPQHHHPPALVQHLVGLVHLPGRSRGTGHILLPFVATQLRAPPAGGDGEAYGRIPHRLLHPHFPRVPHAPGHHPERSREDGGQGRGLRLQEYHQHPREGHQATAEAHQPTDGIPQDNQRQHETACGKRRHRGLHPHHLQRHLHHRPTEGHQHEPHPLDSQP